VDPNCQDVQDFLDLVRAADRHDGLAPRVTVMKPGETLTL
jgi:hypothetical protein